MSGAETVYPLHGNQMRAAAPDESVWLSASAGTGKTQVLSARVLRLLMQPGVEPSQILCLTFTKAGATEMAARINDTLARWVRRKPAELAQELKAIGADFSPEAQARARTLFASVLDCPGGGLRIDTIHAFAQWLLGAFPAEAGLIPGARAMEDRERVLLQRQVLADLLVEAESEPLGDPQLLDALADLSLRLGPDQVESWLMRCAGAIDAWIGPGSWQEPMRPRINQLLGLAADAGESDVAALCSDEHFDTLALRQCMAINREWKARTGQDTASVIADWLACDPLVRSRGIGGLYDQFHTKKGDLRASSSQEKIDPSYRQHVERVAESIARVRDMQALLDLANQLVPAFRLGRAFALAWDEAKSREGLIDFDDQIRMAARLLGKADMADWIRYKLDRRFDHVLVDEAQDTNAAQWRIVDALTSEFWAGLGQRDDRMRTLFVVGDYKQAIFRFQGTSPENFREAANRVRGFMQGAAENLAGLRGNNEPKTLLELGLDRSFRTAQTVLAFVDAAIAAIGGTNFGLSEQPEKHEGEKRPGQVVLWRPLGMASENGEDSEGDEGEESWLSKPERELADLIARQVKHWIEAGYYLEKQKRPANAGDVMVLVRKRGELAALIVARLHEHGVPVAGVDRLRLGAPLAVRDLVAALRFAAQPLDDLNLAALLVSPLMGWSQEQLLAHGYREKGRHLWDHLRANAGQTEIAEALDSLGQLLALADFEPPQALLHWLLSGPWQGRCKLVARLGREANDPIDELLNAAHAYASTATPSIAGFLAWFDAGEGELKREAESAGGLVRVMTVHGAKGLQAPIVILADATGNPDRQGRGLTLDMPDPSAPELRKLPLPPLRREERAGRVAEEYTKIERAERDEHWRLLYVAMTRAEQALFVGGALGQREKAPAPESWYAKLQQVFGDSDWTPDDLWQEKLHWGDAAHFAPPVRSPQLELPPPMPAWLKSAPPDEPRPPRPLAPSSLGEDLSSDPPYPPGGDPAAARRGVLIHKLLERLPEVPPEERRKAGLAWLARNAPQDDGEALLQGVLEVVEASHWADLFSPAALAEVPIAATVGGRVLAGTIDRLLIGPDRIRLVDFKTSRRPPENLARVPLAILRQMAAYTLALEAAYPGRTVDAALLYTEVPRLIEIPPDLLVQHKQALLSPE
ncbi:MAG: double-strand break repair helicase AddA [Novosphingobium sp.]